MNTTHVQDALNKLRELIIRDSGIKSSEDEIELTSGVIKLLPEFNNILILVLAVLIMIMIMQV